MKSVEGVAVAAVRDRRTGDGEAGIDRRGASGGPRRAATMGVVRPVCESDLGGIVEMVRREPCALTSLPDDEDFLAGRVAESVHAFRRGVTRPGDQVYLFGLEDAGSGELLGVSGIAAKVGGFDPFYTYEIRRETHRHDALAVARDFEVLHLVREHSGPSEICSLYLRPKSRGGGRGRLLSLGRFLFLAAFRERFEGVVISEMRGVSDRETGAPFWNAVGSHFFNSDFRSADFQSGIGNKTFIADLMPQHPVYAFLLPDDARAAIGQVHVETRPARSLLEWEGFRFWERVDIFDGGPLLSAKVDEVRTVRERRCGRLAGVREIAGGSEWMVANGRLDFRVTTGLLEVDGADVWLDGPTAAALEVGVGDVVSWVALR